MIKILVCMEIFIVLLFYSNLQLQMILEHSGAMICRIMTLLTDSTKFPVLFHCTHGKDRTGLTIALIQACVGVSEEDIEVDYMASKKFGGTDLAVADVMVRNAIEFSLCFYRTPLWSL